jgi:NMD protein affecting ribosome stability and mRNA decay
MKPNRGSSDENQRAGGHPDDPYRAVKPTEPTRCPGCGATFVGGRWTWAKAPEDAHEHLCPACQRIEDRFPAGYVLLRGDFRGGRRDEVVALIHAKEKQQRSEYPLQRVISIEDVHGGMQVTTTDSLLARGIGEALYETYKGDLKLRYSRDENLLRATWKR